MEEKEKKKEDDRRREEIVTEARKEGRKEGGKRRSARNATVGNLDRSVSFASKTGEIIEGTSRRRTSTGRKRWR